MKKFDIQNAKKHLIAKMNEFDEITQEALKTIFNAIDNSTPKVEIEDERHQIFNGHRYWKNGRGYYQRVEFLHVAVMEYHIGRSIPGNIYEVHHRREGGLEDNNISNLELKTKSEHRSFHNFELKGKKKISNKTAIVKCTVCGADIEVNIRTATREHHFCKNGKCYNEWQRKKYREERIIKICTKCGKNFETYKYSKARYCKICKGKIGQQALQSKRNAQKNINCQ